MKPLEHKAARILACALEIENHARKISEKVQREKILERCGALKRIASEIAGI